jgi:hypothetical protein
MIRVYAFDVDDTLEISNGPVPIKALMDLRVDGHIVGLCGNHVPLLAIPGWQHLISFFNLGLPKDLYLGEFKKYVAALEYVMVGNIGPNDTVTYKVPQTGGSDDMGAAARAGWRFIKEIDFANGAR